VVHIRQCYVADDAHVIPFNLSVAVIKLTIKFHLWKLGVISLVIFRRLVLLYELLLCQVQIRGFFGIRVVVQVFLVKQSLFQVEKDVLMAM
jgi:hypothetical protein